MQSYKEKGKDREEPIAHSLSDSPARCHGQGWVRQKPGTWNFMQVSHVGGRISSTWVLSHCFPQVKWQGAELEMEQPGLKLEL